MNVGGVSAGGCGGGAGGIFDRGGESQGIIAVVRGDDLMPQLDQLLAEGHTLANLDTGSPLSEIRPRVVSANAYLGARPIAAALRQGASIVITGRVADASLALGPAVHEFSWAWEDWDRLAAG